MRVEPASALSVRRCNAQRSFGVPSEVVQTTRPPSTTRVPLGAANALLTSYERHRPCNKSMPASVLSLTESLGLLLHCVLLSLHPRLHSVNLRPKLSDVSSTWDISNLKAVGV